MPDEIAALKLALGRNSRPSSDFDLNPTIILPADRKLRQAAVLVAIQMGKAGASILLTKRASHLNHHPGQIAFPGGKVDENDADAVAAALRESHEEVGLPPQNVEILGCLAPHETVTGFQITPVLGYIRDAFIPRGAPEEVEETFWVPLSLALDPSAYSVEGRIWRGTLRRFYTLPYGPYYIWGATARILRGLADRTNP